MTALGARVLAVDNLGTQYRVIVRIGFPRYRGSFYTLKFGEQKPFTGFTHSGHLDLFSPESRPTVFDLGDSVIDMATYAT
jgi:hypothetical protein